MAAPAAGGEELHRGREPSGAPSAAPPPLPAREPPLLPTEPATGELTLIFAGDLMDHSVNIAQRPYSAIYAAVTPILRRADLAFANLEFAIDSTRPFSAWPCFSVRPDYVQAAIDAGFNVFSVANNHAFDFGTTGVEETYDSMERLALSDGVHFSGVRRRSQHPLEPETIEVKGFRIGFLAVTELLNHGLRSDLVNVVDYRDPAARERFIGYLRSLTRRYDLFILSVHGGVEYDLSPEPAKEALFREAVGAGVGILWGHHPHVLQPWESVVVGGVRHLLIYSNGNFVSGQTSEIDPASPWLPRTFTGDSALFRVRVGRVNGKASVLGVQPILISNYRDAQGTVVVRPLARLATEDLPGRWQDYYRYRWEVMKRFATPRSDFAHGERKAKGTSSPTALLAR